MSFIITSNVKSQKLELLEYFRSRAGESIAEADRVLGVADFKEKANKVNTSLSASRTTLISATKQKAEIEQWSNIDLFEGIMMITYCNLCCNA